MKKTLLAVLLLATSLGAAADEFYKVSATLSHDGKIFGAPGMLVSAGHEASVEVSGAEGFKLTLIVTDAGEGKVKIETTLDSSYGSISPSMIVMKGEPATVSVDELEIGLTVDRFGS